MNQEVFTNVHYGKVQTSREASYTQAQTLANELGKNFYVYEHEGIINVTQEGLGLIPSEARKFEPVKSGPTPFLQKLVRDVLFNKQARRPLDSRCAVFPGRQGKASFEGVHVRTGQDRYP